MDVLNGQQKSPDRSLCEDMSNAKKRYDEWIEQHRAKGLDLDEALKGSLAKSDDPLAKICLVADWGSIPSQTLPFEDQIRVAKEIREKRNILGPLMSLKEDWLQNHQLMRNAVEEIKKTELLKPHGAKANNLSFASKFLHWCVSPSFPIFDSYSLAAMKKMSRKEFSANPSSSKYESRWDWYASEWTDGIRDLINDHRQCCLMKSQQEGEGLVRTIDKVLWQMGKDMKPKRGGNRSNKKDT
ncbi:MAG: hypothetical protein HY520_04710 [Candidatus Aenigmarchaeota archaeon]|nr:hypothetical protein [Candidatus Aenigmarchaeota archaeon]